MFLSHKISPLATLPATQCRAWSTSPHPKRLPIIATCFSDRTVRIYSLTSFTRLSNITGGHKRSIRTCAWKPDCNNVLATGSFDASVGIWRHHGSADDALDVQANDNDSDTDEWRFAIVLDGHESEVKSVAWSSGGNFLATCSRDKSVWIWEEVGEDDYETIAVLQEHEGDVKCVAWHPEELLLASASYDDDIRLWKEDVDDWGCVAVLRGHESTVWCVDWEGAGKRDRVDGEERAGPRLVSCSDDGTVKIWERQQTEEKPKQNAMSIIRSGSNEEEWLEIAKLPQQHQMPVYSVAWSKVTGRIASVGGDGKIVVYEGPPKTKDWLVLAEIDDAHGVLQINNVCWAPRADRGKRFEGEEILITTGDEGVIKVWTIDDPS